MKVRRNQPELTLQGNLVCYLMAKFRNFLLYGEQGLARQEAVVNIYQDVLTLEHNEEKLSRSSVEW